MSKPVIQLMSRESFTGEMPALMAAYLITFSLLMRVHAEVPAIHNTDLGCAIRDIVQTGRVATVAPTGQVQ